MSDPIEGQTGSTPESRPAPVTPVAPPPGPPPAPSPDGEASASTSAERAGPDGQAPARRRRRRGSRGGRGRARPAGAAGTDGADDGPGEGAPADASLLGGALDDRRPDDLPDRPSEGRPSPEAAARAEVVRPKIGDTRPA